MRNAILAVIVLAAAATPARADEKIRTRVDFEAVQGLLAVASVDGWLMYDYQGQNPIAQELVNPKGLQTRRWFYYIPKEVQPIALIHKVEASNFDRIPGKKIEYAGWRPYWTTSPLIIPPASKTGASSPPRRFRNK